MGLFDKLGEWSERTLQRLEGAKATSLIPSETALKAFQAIPGETREAAAQFMMVAKSPAQRGEVGPAAEKLVEALNGHPQATAHLGEVARNDLGTLKLITNEIIALYRGQLGENALLKTLQWSVDNTINADQMYRTLNGTLIKLDPKMANFLITAAAINSLNPVSEESVNVSL